MPKLTIEEFSKIMYEEFGRDNWGLVDPDHFENPPKINETGDESIDGLYEVFKRITNRINGTLKEKNQGLITYD